MFNLILKIQKILIPTVFGIHSRNLAKRSHEPLFVANKLWIAFVLFYFYGTLLTARLIHKFKNVNYNILSLHFRDKFDIKTLQVN